MRFLRGAQGRGGNRLTVQGHGQVAGHRVAVECLSVRMALEASVQLRSVSTDRHQVLLVRQVTEPWTRRSVAECRNAISETGTNKQRRPASGIARYSSVLPGYRRRRTSHRRQGIRPACHKGLSTLGIDAIPNHKWNSPGAIRSPKGATSRAFSGSDPSFD